MGETKKIFLDPLARPRQRLEEYDLSLARFVTKHKKNSLLFSKHRITDSFFTSDSKLYITPEEYRRQRRGERILRLVGRLDSLHSRVFADTRIYEGAYFVPLGPLARLHESYNKFREQANSLVTDSTQKLTLVRAWNLSIVGAVIFGMFTMTLIYKYLGQNVSAQINDATQNRTALVQEVKTDQGRVLGAETEADQMSDVDINTITKLLETDDNVNEQAALEKEMLAMVKGYPIEKMVPLIAKKDQVVAAMMIGIARQESGWGEHVPVYKGQDCWNYWGYRGKNPVGTGGHTCFASPQDAVDTVAKRIQFLVSNKKLDTPAKMIVWKCGDCSWDSQENMRRWINTVSTFFHKLNKENKK